MAEGRVFHGGDLSWAEEIFGTPRLPWIDLSTGVNPFPYPFSAPPAASFARLPDAAAARALTAAAAGYYGAPDAACIAASPGTQMLIQLLPRLRAPGRVAVIGPSYGEHAACWEAGGHTVTVAADMAEADDCDVVVITNPNNPDGREHAPAMLDGLAGRLAERSGWLVIDEAFADVAPHVSLAAGCARPGLIVLRSFGKFFGLPGVRLGFALAAPALAARIAAALGPWAVSGPAASIGTEALADAGWADGARRRLVLSAQALDRLLAGAGLAVVGGTALFRLVEDAGAPALFRTLGERGLLVRHFPEAPHRLRFGLPGEDAALDRLADALSAWRTGAAA